MTYKTGSVVDDQDYDSLIDKYNAAFASTGGIGITKKNEGEVVTRNDWFNLWQKVFDTANAQGRFATLPFHSSAPGENPFSDAVARNYGYLISALPSWGAIGDPPADVTVGFTAANFSGKEPPAPVSGSGAGSSDVRFPPGTPTITIPPYDILRITVSGGGGAGNIGQGTTQADRIGDAAPGESSSVPALGLTGAGGAGGPGALTLGYNAQCQTNSNVDLNRRGGLGTGGQYNGLKSDLVYGVAASANVLASGALSDNIATTNLGINASTVGGNGAVGGQGFKSTCTYGTGLTGQEPFTGGEGSSGGAAIRVWTRGEPGAPEPGTVLPVTVGRGGAGVNGAAPADLAPDRPGGYNGADGFIRVQGIISNPATFAERFSGGTHQFVVPQYTTMRVTVSGGGGGGANNILATPIVYPGKVGGDSSFLSMRANGGALGNCAAQDPFASYPPSVPPPAASPASGGDSNVTGGGGRGGTGTGFTQYEGVPNTLLNSYSAGQGGTGGKSVKVWNVTDAGAPQPGQVITLTVGFGGAGGWQDARESAEVDRAVNNNPTNTYGVITKESYAKLGGGLDGEEGYALIEGTMVPFVRPSTPDTPVNALNMIFKVALDKASNKEVRVNYATSDIPGGASSAFAQVYDKPGTYTYALPQYTTLSVDVNGAGGGAGFPGNASNVQGGLPAKMGQPGGNSIVASVIGGGGGGGKTTSSPPADPGAASGGDNNIPGGGAAGAPGMSGSSSGNGNVTLTVPDYYPGGAGGRAVKTWSAGAAGAPPAGSLTVVVGKRGYGANYEDYDTYILTISDQSQKDFYNSAALKMWGSDGVVRISGTTGTAGAGASATAGTDYTATSGTLVFAPGETYKEIGVPVLYDGVPEPDELFLMTLSSPVGTKIGVGSATGTILGASVGGGTSAPPVTAPVVDQPGTWKGYYKPSTELPTFGNTFFGQQYWYWQGTSTHPTPDLPFPAGFTAQGDFCQSDGNCQNGTPCPCTGLMSYGNPYEGGTVLTCFPGKQC